MADLIIKGGRVLTMNGGIIDGGVIAVESGLITFVGKGTKERAQEVIDAKGCAVMPGLINAHTHLPMTLFRGVADDLAYEEWTKKIQRAEAKLSPKDVRAGAYLGVLEMIKTGTTSFADMYIHMDEVAQVVEETGMRASLGYGMIEGRNEDSETKLKSRADFVRKWSGAGLSRITTMYAPHSALSCSREFLIKVREKARKDMVGIHIHVLETEDELNLMKKRYGMCSIKFLDSIDFLGSDVLAAHCVWLSDDDIGILKGKNVNVVHCPTSNMALGVGIAPVQKMLERGINVALGTDSAASSGSLDMWKEMRMASLLHKVKDPAAMPVSKVLEMATVNGARAMGINAGALAPGYLADVIIVDIKKPQFTSSNLISALVHGASGCDVKTTIVDGKILMEDYEIKVLDEEKIIEDAINAMLINIRDFAE
ncbi:MAG: amidohydrolase family protein [Candidatus Methanoperedens sp.]|nr:amidohydrolase family protein [Candidatus Methanoperedens sp.]MCZ7395004.1 amidohydrolase family protein [Candidatus Methanoperedens sp.]